MPSGKERISLLSYSPIEAVRMQARIISGRAPYYIRRPRPYTLPGKTRGCTITSFRKTGETDYNIMYEVAFTVDGRAHKIGLVYMKTSVAPILLEVEAKTIEDMEAYCKCMNEILREARRVVG